MQKLITVPTFEAIPMDQVYRRIVYILHKGQNFWSNFLKYTLMDLRLGTIISSWFSIRVILLTSDLRMYIFPIVSVSINNSRASSLRIIAIYFVPSFFSINRNVESIDSTCPCILEENEINNEAGHALWMVDMPGYGYAKESKSKISAWNKLLRSYLRGRMNLRRVFVLIDARHGLKSNDIDILNLLDEAAVSYQIVLTKADKPKQDALAATLQTMQTMTKFEN